MTSQPLYSLNWSIKAVFSTLSVLLLSETSLLRITRISPNTLLNGREHIDCLHHGLDWQLEHAGMKTAKSGEHYPVHHVLTCPPLKGFTGLVASKRQPASSEAHTTLLAFSWPTWNDSHSIFVLTRDVGSGIHWMKDRAQLSVLCFLNPSKLGLNVSEPKAVLCVTGLCSIKW